MAQTPDTAGTVHASLSHLQTEQSRTIARSASNDMPGRSVQSATLTGSAGQQSGQAHAVNHISSMTASSSSAGSAESAESTSTGHSTSSTAFTNDSVSRSDNVGAARPTPAVSNVQAPRLAPSSITSPPSLTSSKLPKYTKKPSQQVLDNIQQRLTTQQHSPKKRSSFVMIDSSRGAIRRLPTSHSTGNISGHLRNLSFELVDDENSASGPPSIGTMGIRRMPSTGPSRDGQPSSGQSPPSGKRLMATAPTKRYSGGGTSSVAAAAAAAKSMKSSAQTRTRLVSNPKNQASQRPAEQQPPPTQSRITHSISQLSLNGQQSQQGRAPVPHTNRRLSLVSTASRESLVKRRSPPLRASEDLTVPPVPPLPKLRGTPSGSRVRVDLRADRAISYVDPISSSRRMYSDSGTAMRHPRQPLSMYVDSDHPIHVKSSSNPPSQQTADSFRPHMYRREHQPSQQQPHSSKGAPHQTSTLSTSRPTARKVSGPRPMPTSGPRQPTMSLYSAVPSSAEKIYLGASPTNRASVISLDSRRPTLRVITKSDTLKSQPQSATRQAASHHGVSQQTPGSSRGHPLRVVSKPVAVGPPGNLPKQSTAVRKSATYQNICALTSPSVSPPDKSKERKDVREGSLDSNKASASNSGLSARTEKRKNDKLSILVPPSRTQQSPALSQPSSPLSAGHSGKSSSMSFRARSKLSASRQWGELVNTTQRVLHLSRSGTPNSSSPSTPAGSRSASNLVEQIEQPSEHQLEIQGIMKKLVTRNPKKQILDVNSIKDKQSPAMTAAQATKKCFLNMYEKGEILEYRKIYFTGAPDAKKVSNSSRLLVTNNYGFDDKNGDYQVVVGDHIAYRYRILDTLGNGSFGKVLRCLDYKTGRLVAVKMVINKKMFHMQALIESELLKMLTLADSRDRHNIVRYIDHFNFRDHLCITTELLGINLYELIKFNNYHGLPMPLVKHFTKQLVDALRFISSKNIIHCDLKPENILLSDSLNGNIKLVDFGSSCHVNEKVYTYIQSRFYRSPEVILGMVYGLEIDIWSMGCIVAEMLSGKPLFMGETENEQIACIIEILGAPSRQLVSKCSRREMFFDNTGRPLLYKPPPESKNARLHPPNSVKLCDAVKCDDPVLLSFLEQCLKWNAKSRMNAIEASHHPFLLRPAESYQVQ